MWMDGRVHFISCDPATAGLSVCLAEWVKTENSPDVVLSILLDPLLTFPFFLFFPFVPALHSDVFTSVRVGLDTKRG